MYHFFDAILNSTGDAQPGYFVRLIDPATQNVVPIYADDAGTPIITASGVANMAKTDSLGNVDFYVEPDSYNLEVYAPDAITFKKRIVNVAMTSTQGEKGDQGEPGGIGPVGPSNNSRADLAALKAAATTDLTSLYDGAVWMWTLGNFTGQADDVNIVKANSAALSVGAWVRQKSAAVSFQQSGTGAVTRSVEAKARETISVTDFGAVGDGVTDNAAAFQAAWNEASARKAKLLVPNGTFIIGCPNVCPNATAGNKYQGYQSWTDAQFGTSLKYGVEMKSNVTMELSGGAVIKAAPGISSDASPQNFALFFSLAYLQNVAFVGTGTFDMNAANNKMSPNRAQTGTNPGTGLPWTQEERYGRMNQAAIMWEGPFGKVDNFIVDGLTFRNHNGVSVIVTGRIATPVLGKVQRVTRCKFFECGLDSYDLSAVNFMGDDVLLDDIDAGNAVGYSPSATDLSGFSALYETHGSNFRVSNLRTFNTNRTGFISYALNYNNWFGIDPVLYAGYTMGFAPKNVTVSDSQHTGVKYSVANIGFSPISGVTEAPENINFARINFSMSGDDTNLSAGETPTGIECIGVPTVGIQGVKRLTIEDIQASRPFSASGRSSQVIALSLQASDFEGLSISRVTGTGFTRGVHIVTDTNMVAGDLTIDNCRFLDPLGGVVPATTKTGINIIAQGGTARSWYFNPDIRDTRPTQAVTFTDAGDLVTANGHAYVNGRQVTFDSIVTTTGISINTVYFVINATTNTFQLAATLGGSAIALTTNGTGVVRPAGWEFGIFANRTGSTTIGTFHVAQSTRFDDRIPVANRTSLANGAGTIALARVLGVPALGSYPDTSYGTLSGAVVTAALPGVVSTDVLEFSLTNSTNPNDPVTNLGGFTPSAYRTGTDQVGLALRNVTAGTLFTTPGFSFRIVAYPKN